MAARKRLGELLLEAGLLTPGDLEAALQVQRAYGGQLGQILVDRKAITEDRLVRVLSSQLRVPVADLPENEVAPGLLEAVPVDIAEKSRVFPIGVRKEGKVDMLYLAMADPTDIATIDSLQFKLGFRIYPMIAGDTAIVSAIRRHYHGERRREVAAQSPVQFAGTEVVLDLEPVQEDDIPLVTGVLTTPAQPVVQPAFARAPQAAAPPPGPVATTTASAARAPERSSFPGVPSSLVPSPALAIGSPLPRAPTSTLPTAVSEPDPEDDLKLELAFGAAGSYLGFTSEEEEQAALAKTPPPLASLDPSPPPAVEAAAPPTTPPTTPPAVVEEPVLELDDVEDAPTLPPPPVPTMPPPRLPTPPASPYAAPLPRVITTVLDVEVMDAPMPPPAPPPPQRLPPPPRALTPLPPVVSGLASTPTPLPPPPKPLLVAPVAPAPSAPPTTPPPAPPGPVAPAPEVAPAAANVRSTVLPSTESPIMANPLPGALTALPYCPDCGANRVEGAKFCPHCGLSFTGAQRAKGALPSTPPATRPMMPAVAPRPAPAALDPSKLDIAELEGIKPGIVLPLPLRPRTASAANADEPEVLGGKDSAVGLGVTLLVPSIVTDASRPDDVEVIAGRKPAASPVAPMHLHVVTGAMARVDDEKSLAPGAPAAAPARAPAPAPAPAPARAAAPAAGPAPSVDLRALEWGLTGTMTTSPAGLVDDPGALTGGAVFALGLGVTHQGAVLADASLVDDPAVLTGGKAAASHITRAVLDEVRGTASHVDDPVVLAPKAPRAAAVAQAPVSLSKDWADVAERPIPRKDNRTDVAEVPRSREVFFAPEAAALPPPPPPPEPTIEYVPAPPAPAAAPAPWAAFGAPTAAAPAPAPVETMPAPSPAPAAAPAASTKPLTPTMVMSLDQVELRALAERLMQKGALSPEDLEAAKNKK